MFCHCLGSEIFMRIEKGTAGPINCRIGRRLYDFKQSIKHKTQHIVQCAQTPFTS